MHTNFIQSAYRQVWLHTVNTYKVTPRGMHMSVCTKMSMCFDV